MNRKTYIITALLLLLGTLAFLPFDHSIAEACHQIPANVLPLIQAITKSGESQYILVPALLLMLVYAKKRQDKVFRSALLVFTTIATSGIAVQILKYLFGRARPKDLWNKGIDGFYGMTGSSSLTSFPSGHTATAVAFAITMWILFPKTRIPVFIYAFLVAVSRVLLLQHFPSDIMAGALIAFLTTIPLAKTEPLSRISSA